MTDDERPEPTPGPLRRLAPEDIKRIVGELIRNELFLSSQVKDADPKMMGTVFLPIMFGALKHFTEEACADIGMIYGRYDTALPRGINGYPMLTSCCFVHKDDWTAIVERFKKVKAAMDAVDEP